MVKCSDITCKYNKNYICKSKKIDLLYYNINTTYQGRQKLLKCKTYEKSKEYEKIEDLVKDFFKKE